MKAATKLVYLVIVKVT